jgi:transcriptional regulator with XRE-family HTH domain
MNAIQEGLAKDRELNAVYQRELARLQIANQIAKLREHAGISQAELARRIGTKQAGVARMERRSYRGYTIGTLARIAAATGARLEVRLAPRGSRTGR